MLATSLTASSASAGSVASGANSASKSFWRQSLGRNQLEGLAQRLLRVQALDQHLGDLAPRHDAIARIARMAPVALEEDETMFVRAVVVEPAGTHDRVRKTARANQPR
jgi:hypothetical protein